MKYLLQFFLLLTLLSLVYPFITWASHKPIDGYTACIAMYIAIWVAYSFTELYKKLDTLEALLLNLKKKLDSKE